MRKIRSTSSNRVQPQINENSNMPYIGSSRFKYAPYLTINFNRTEQFTAGSFTPIDPACISGDGNGLYNGSYIYDAYADLLQLENRWRLDTGMSAIGVTTTSVGTIASLLIQQMNFQNGLSLVSGLTLNTQDSLGQKLMTSGIPLWFQPETLPQELTVGMWFDPPPNLGQAIFSIGASPTLYQQGYHGCWVDTAGTRGVRVQFGDGNQFGYSNRLSYYSADNVMPASGPVFIVMRLSRSGVATSNQFDLFINGNLISVPFPGYGVLGGEASTTVYGDRIVYGANMWTASNAYNTGVMDEPFMISKHLTNTQIQNLYTYGSTAYGGAGPSYPSAICP